MVKTNAMRVLDSLGLEYKILAYETDDGKLDGRSVSDKIGRSYENVFKTLVTQGDRDYYVFIIPVMEELDLKKAAKLVGEKKIDMLAVKDIKKVTGYVRGGCSPLAMKKEYKTYIDSSAKLRDKIVISGGRIGSQIEIELKELKKAIDLEVADLV